MNMSKSVLYFTGAPIAMPAPATAPTIEWLVEIGIFQYVAKITHRHAPRQATSAKYIAKSLSSWSMGTIPLLMVFTTWPPCKKAPRNPNKAIKIMACFKFRTLDPTAAPNELAASFAPIDQPRSEEHTSELQSQFHLVCRLLLEK